VGAGSAICGSAACTSEPYGTELQELFLQPRVQLDGTQDPCTGAAPAASAAACALTGVTAAEYGNIARNPAGQYNGLAGGNVSLAPEKADTYTVGLVLTPKFLPDFNMTLDYYNITVKSLISTYGANLILSTCLASADPFYCGKVHRTQGPEPWRTDHCGSTATDSLRIRIST